MSVLACWISIGLDLTYSDSPCWLDLWGSVLFLMNKQKLYISLNSYDLAVYSYRFTSFHMSLRHIYIPMLPKLTRVHAYMLILSYYTSHQHTHTPHTLYHKRLSAPSTWRKTLSVLMSPHGPCRACLCLTLIILVALFITPNLKQLPRVNIILCVKETILHIHCGVWCNNC